MGHPLLDGLIILLVFLVGLAVIIALWQRSELKTCETVQSTFCYQFTCPTSAGLDPECESSAFRCSDGSTPVNGVCSTGTKMCSM